VESLSPTVGSTARTQVVSLAVGHVNTSLITAPEVMFGNRSCAVKEFDAPEASNNFTCSVTCVLPRSPPGAPPQSPVSPQVYFPGSGYANPVDFTLATGLFVSSVVPDTGSVLGGNVVTIGGSGFGADSGFVKVSLLDDDDEEVGVCDPINVSPFEIQCIPSVVGVPNDTYVTMSVMALNYEGDTYGGYVAPCQDAIGGCEYGLLANRTPVVVSGVVSDNVTNTGLLMLTGSGLVSPLSVKIGPHVCVVQSVSGDSVVVCELPVAAADAWPVRVTVESMGSAVCTLRHRFPLIVTSVSGATGSLAGGTTVVISGQGFGATTNSTVVLFGGDAGRVIASSPTTVTVLTPASRVATSSSVAIVVRVLPSAGSLLSLGDANVLNEGVPGVSRSGTNVTASTMFVYDATLSFTPLLISVSPTQGSAGTVLTVNGRGFGASVSTSSVTIGGFGCAINATSWSDTTFRCVVGASPADTHAVQVEIVGKGFAWVNGTTAVTFRSLLGVASVGPLLGGFGGGVAITVTGSGFAPASSLRTVVTLCGRVCNVVSSSYSSVTCLTPSITTQETLLLGNVVPVEILTGFGVIGFGQSSSHYMLAFDGDVTTTSRTYSATFASTCNVGIDMGVDVVAQVTRVRYFPNFAKSSVMRGGVFEGSMDGVSYVALVSVEGRVQEGWNYADVSGNATYRYLRYRGPWNSYCEVRWVGTQLEPWGLH
jgi:IPT/TIG domain